MTVTTATALRSVLADAVDNYINTTGSANSAGILRVRDSTTTLVDIDLQNPAFGAASSGVITLAGVPLSGVATGAGDADNFQILDRDEAVALSGSITGTGGGGDIEADNVSIAVDQTVQITALTYTAPA